MRGEAILITQLAHTLDGGVETAEGLPKALPGFPFPTHRRRQKWQTHRCRLEEFGQVVIRGERDVALA